jgi:hypothetical protein
MLPRTSEGRIYLIASRVSSVYFYLGANVQSFEFAQIHSSDWGCGGDKFGKKSLTSTRREGSKHSPTTGARDHRKVLIAMEERT